MGIYNKGNTSPIQTFSITREADARGRVRDMADAAEDLHRLQINKKSPVGGLLMRKAALWEAAEERTHLGLCGKSNLESDADAAGDVEFGLWIGDGGVEVSLAENFDEAEWEEDAGAGVTDWGSGCDFWGVV